MTKKIIIEISENQKLTEIIVKSKGYKPLEKVAFFEMIKNTEIDFLKSGVYPEKDENGFYSRKITIGN